MQTIRVNLAEQSYNIEIGRGNLDHLGQFLADRAKTSHVVLITDENVHAIHATRAAESIGEQEIDVDVIVVPPGEESKSLDVAASLWQGLLDLGADRRSVVAAVGGGVVGDLAGFAAATFARGLRFLQVPTTLLAQVDSSVGGKTGINLPEAKNIIGAFHQPAGVLIDVAVLSTLPDREYRSGLAEVVKYGAALDAEFFEYLEQNASAVLERNEEVLIEIVTRCCRLKAEIVERDERDQTGLRAALNFGHTIGHAFELISPLPQAGEGLGVRAAGTFSPLLHGEAISIGMVLAAQLAERLGRVDDSFTNRLRSLLQTFGLPVEPSASDPKKMLDIMMNDKKAENDRLVFILPSRLGHVEPIDNISVKEISNVLSRT